LYCLMQLADSLASEISEKTNESRTNTYDTLNSLIKKGLVCVVIKDGMKYFSATSPKNLLKWVDLRMAEVENERKLVEKMIPDLEKLRLPTEKKVIVEVYEGKEGVRTALKETVDSAKAGNKELLIFGAIAGHLRDLDPIYHERYYKERKENKIKTRYIFIEGEKHPESELAQYKYLPKTFKSFAATAIHGDEVSFWLLTNPLFIVLVKNKEFAQTYRSNFEELWKVAKKH
jgi:sugar-specific transcriptional regulator TrmB